MEDIAEKFKNKVMVSLDENDWKSMEEECKDGFVLKLANGLPFNLTGLSNVLTKMWNMERRVNFTELGNNMALARFRHRSDMQKIRDGGPWLCLGTFIVMHDWCPDLSPEEFVMKRLGVWAQFHNLPVGAVLKGKEVGEKLAPNIGSLVKVSQAESETSKKRYIRVRVEIAIDKVPVTGFFLERPSRDPLWVSVIYERLPGGCLRCGKLDHVTEDCSLQTEQGLARGQGDGGSKAAKSVSKGSRTEAEVARGGGSGGKETMPNDLIRRWDRRQGKRPVVEIPVNVGGGKPPETIPDDSRLQWKERSERKAGSVAAGTYVEAETSAADCMALVLAELYVAGGDITTVAMSDAEERERAQGVIVSYEGDRAAGVSAKGRIGALPVRSTGPMLLLDGPEECKWAQSKSSSGGGEGEGQVDSKSSRLVYRRGKKGKGKGVVVDTGGSKRFQPYSTDRRAIHLVGSREVEIRGHNGRNNNQISAEVAQLPRREP
ncbi:unnamed protein product [Rhodiola kirilowii]